MEVWSCIYIYRFRKRFYRKSIKTGTVVSTVFAVVVAGGSYFLGGFSRLFGDKATYVDGKLQFDSLIPGMLSTLPDLLIGIVVVLVLSASMSTLSSLVMTSSSTLTLDLIKGNIVKNLSEKKQVFLMRVFIAVFIIISVVLALDPPIFIAQLMGISWGALAGAVAMVVGLIVVPVVSLLTPKLKDAFVKNVFTCYDKPVVVSSKKSLDK